MARKSLDVAHQLQEAAFELFHERGFEQATAAEIAARAGVTERTFFRHFADKRDILFECQDNTSTILADYIVSAPAHFGPMKAFRFALHSAGPSFEEKRLFVKPRLEVIMTTPALRERQAGRTVSMTAELTQALEQRGVAPLVAGMAAQLGMTAFGYAWSSWLEDGSESWDCHLDRAFDQLNKLSADHEYGEVPAIE